MSKRSPQRESSHLMMMEEKGALFVTFDGEKIAKFPEQQPAGHTFERESLKPGYVVLMNAECTKGQLFVYVHAGTVSTKQARRHVGGAHFNERYFR